MPNALAFDVAEDIADAQDRGPLNSGDFLFTNADKRPVLNAAFHGHA